MVKLENLNGFDETLIKFLDAQKASTRKTYKCFLKKMLEYTGMTGAQILESKKADKNFEWEGKALDFKQWLKKQKTTQGNFYSDNAAKASIASLRSFFDFYRTPLVFNQNENRKLNGKAQRTTHDYMLTNDDIAKMVFVADLREKYIVLTGKSFGLRAGDFASITYGTFRSVNLEGEAPIGIGELQTEKEGVVAFPFIDSDALPVVKAWLDGHQEQDVKIAKRDGSGETVKDSNGEIVYEIRRIYKDADRIITIHDDELSSILQSLGVKANINLGGKHLRFHCFRKWLIDRLSSMMSESKWKQIVGKSISEDAYVSTFELKESYSKAMKMTTVLTNGNGKVSKVLEEMQVTKSQLADVIAMQQKDGKELANIIIQQQKDKEKLEKQISDMYQYVHKNLDPVRDAFLKITGTPEGHALWQKIQTEECDKEYEESRATEADMDAKNIEAFEKTKTED